MREALIERIYEVAAEIVGILADSGELEGDEDLDVIAAWIVEVGIGQALEGLKLISG